MVKTRAQERDELQAELAAARAEAGRARAEAGRARAEAAEAKVMADRYKADVERLTGSTSYRLGRTLVQTVRRPGRIVELPTSLARVIRRRGAPTGPATAGAGGGAASGATSTVAAAASAVIDGVRRPQDRFFLADSGIAIGARTRPVVAGILTDATAGALEVDAVVDRLTPHDALVVLERSEPDLVLIETAAFAASNPWAYAADPAAVERAETILAIVRGAHAQGRPVVLVRGSGGVAHVGLIPLERHVDLVLEAAPGADGATGWSRGVQLARFHPIGRATAPDGPTLFVGGLDPRASAASRRSGEALLRAAAARGLDLLTDAGGSSDAAPFPDDLAADARGRVAWRDLPARYREATRCIANPIWSPERIETVAARTLEQLASGARVVSGPNAALAAVAGGSVSFVDDRDDVAAGYATAIAAGLPTPDETWAVLRRLFVDHATPAMLGGITARLGLPADPRWRRSVTAVVALGDGAAAAATVDSLLAQSHRPRRALVAADGADAGWPEAARVALEAAGIAVEGVPAGGAVPSWLAAPGRAAPTSWVVRWPEASAAGPDLLLDLVLGAEMSGADAVGAAPGERMRYVTTLSDDGVLVRREALEDAGVTAAAGPGGSWLAEAGTRGWRQFSIGPGAGR